VVGRYNNMVGLDLLLLYTGTYRWKLDDDDGNDDDDDNIVICEVYIRWTIDVGDYNSLAVPNSQYPTEYNN